MPPCGGAPNFSASSRKPNFRRASSARDAEQPEDRRLQLLAVDTHRAAADLRAVQHHVVGLGHSRPGIGGERRRIIDLGGSERVVHRDPALRVRVPLEHREVDDPQRPPALHEELQIVADLQPQRAERIADHLGRVGAEEDEVVVLGAGALEDAGDRLVAQELDDRRLQPLAALRAAR